MQAVILAAGRGTRMGNLTERVPKPMLTIGGRTLLEHKFDHLPESIDKIIIIVGYREDSIRKTYGDSYKGKPVQYVVQNELNGTMGAVALVQPYVQEKFLIMMGDDLYSTKDIQTILESEDWTVLVAKREDMTQGGYIVTDSEGMVTNIEEGNHSGKNGYMNTNMFLLDKRIFDYPMIPKAPGSNEFGLPQTVVSAALRGNIPLHTILSSGWIQITSPEDLTITEARLAEIEEVG